MGLDQGTFEQDAKLDMMMKVAQRFSIPGVDEVVKQIRKIVGDYPGVTRIIDTWIAAETPLGMAAQHLEKAQRDLPEAWTGSAANVYNGYLTAIRASTKQLLDITAGADGVATGGIIANLQLARNAVLANYQALLTLVTDAAAAVIEALGTVGGAIGKIVAGVAQGGEGVGQAVDGAAGAFSGVTKVLADLIRAFGMWITKVLEAVNMSRSAIEGIRAQAGKLVIPAA